MSRPTPSLQAQFEHRIAALTAPQERICVGFSGGLDSRVLLHLSVQAPANIRSRLSAVHIHHGLSPHADAWAAFCQDTCDRAGIPLVVHQVEVARDSGLGLEGAAREARYGVYRQIDAECIALAHHADDAAETLLLRLLRGTGIRGLAGMAASRRLDQQRRVVRPLLLLRRAALLAFAQAEQLTWIEDESNADRGLDRNFLRHAILTQVEARFPGYPGTLLRAADNAADAQQLLDELAQADLGGATTTLSVSALRQLSAPRARNALRAFLDRQGIAMPDAVHLHEAVRQIQTGGANAALAIALEGAQMRQSGDALLVVPQQVLQDVADFVVPWAGEAEVPLAALGGKVVFRAARGAGIAQARIEATGWELRHRQGGETLRVAANRPSRSLKNLFQECGVPAWERERLPLLFHGERLVWVPGLGIAAEYQCVAGAAGIEPLWQPGTPSEPVLHG